MSVGFGIRAGSFGFAAKHAVKKAPPAFCLLDEDGMPKAFRDLVFVLPLCFLGFLACDPTTTKPPDPEGCASDRVCWKEKCPQTEAPAYQACLMSYYKAAGGPKYLVCEAKVCKELPQAEQGTGKIEVNIPRNLSQGTLDRVSYLRHYVFPAVDLDGKAITCDRLQAEAAKTPEILMSEAMARYFPPRDWDAPLTTPIQRIAETLPLIINTPVPVAQNLVVVVQGFCKADNAPTTSTPAKWFSCKESQRIAKVSDNLLTLALPVKENDCF